ncbi:hypothetical protein SLG_17530 [Sphingobium sp. SYK-6]|uniref:hypothetical protein n=1 Tax=Sphingobium sp. (strain NBRC 103272 / SYK-6) TaxID=627192 RepID=UPI0002277216|nr:hypothetical protein [Sphingobium sp. SYK-6]BAK66428.1 hypothetical protein SLG_17530 [Sphingobium sp. SYK-6]
MSIQPDLTRYGNVDDVAEITGLAKQTLVQYRLYRPELSPPFARIGRRVVYPLTGPNSVTSWMEQRLRNTEGAA